MEEKSAQTSTDRRMNMTDKTLDYYNKNAQSFVSGTVSVKFTQIQDKFLEKLKNSLLSAWAERKLLCVRFSQYNRPVR